MILPSPSSMTSPSPTTRTRKSPPSPLDLSALKPLVPGLRVEQSRQPQTRTRRAATSPVHANGLSSISVSDLSNDRSHDEVDIADADPTLRGGGGEFDGERTPRPGHIQLGGRGLSTSEDGEESVNASADATISSHRDQESRDTDLNRAGYHGDPGPKSLASRQAVEGYSSNREGEGASSVISPTSERVGRSATPHRMGSHRGGSFSTVSNAQPNPGCSPHLIRPSPSRRSSSDDLLSSTPSQPYSHPIPISSANPYNSTNHPHFLDPEAVSLMSRWVEEIVTCNFDLDRGPVVERRMMGREWGKGEKANVAFSAFPDTSLFQEGHITYSFKIRDTSPSHSSLALGGTDRRSRSSNDATNLLTNPLIRNHGDANEDPISSHLHPNNLATSSSPASYTLPPPRTPPSRPLSQPFFGSSSEAPDTPMTETILPTKMEVADDYRKWDGHGREWLYGFVWFEQRRDEGIARGYMQVSGSSRFGLWQREILRSFERMETDGLSFMIFPCLHSQRSMVILSHRPFPALFYSVLECLAPIYFEDGYTAFQAACKIIARWPDPTPGSHFKLPINDRLLNVKLPEGNEAPQLDPIAITSPHPVTDQRLLLASLPCISPLRAFSTFLPSLWHIWECVMLNESLLVIAPDPKQCSDIVWWIKDLLRPIPSSSADFRPYLHIHDLDFRLLVTAEKPQPGLILGVTNPFFRNAAGHWPNVINVLPAGGDRKPSQAGRSSIPEPAAGFVSKRKRHVSKDRVLLKRLEKLVAEGRYDGKSPLPCDSRSKLSDTDYSIPPPRNSDPAGNAALRAYFMQLTEKMLSPLNRYVNSLIPPSESMDGIKPFVLSDFLAHLKATAPNPLQFRPKGLTPKSKVEIEFYTKFCSSPGFAEWQTRQLNSLGEARSDLRIAAVSTLFSKQEPFVGRARSNSTTRTEEDSDFSSNRSSMSSRDTAPAS